MEDDEIDQEGKSLITYKGESFADEQSNVASLFPEPEEEDVRVEDETYLTVDEDEERINNDKEEIDDNEETEPPKNVEDVSLEKESELPDDKDELQEGEEEKEEEEEEKEEEEKEEKEEEEKEEEKEKEEEEEKEEKEEEKEEEEEEEEEDKKKKPRQEKKRIGHSNRKFREILGKRESKKEELEKREGNLRQRLDVLECSMPAVMVWNVWERMSQGAPVPNLHRLMEKQFRTPAAGEVYCPSTPSRHYDCRVREIEAERKAAQRRLDEARLLWLEKEVKLKERREKLEDAKRIQKERKEKIERLTNEAKKLKEALKKVNEEDITGFCESGDQIRK